MCLRKRPCGIVTASSQGHWITCGRPRSRSDAPIPGACRPAMTEQLATSEAGRKWRPGIGERLDSGDHGSPRLAARMAVNLLGGRADALVGRLIYAHEDFEAIVAETDTIVREDRRVLRIR